MLLFFLEDQISDVLLQDELERRPTMTGPEVTKRFEAWRAVHARKAWKPHTRLVSTARTYASKTSQSHFGGLPRRDDFDWPACSQCKEPMRLLLQLDLDDLPPAYRDGPPSSKLLHLYYCSVDDGKCKTWKPFLGANLVEVVPRGAKLAGPPDDDLILNERPIVCWEEFVDYPSTAEHRLLGVAYQYDFDNGRVSVKCSSPSIDLEDLDINLDVAERVSTAELGDKLGGWPRWIQDVDYPACPKCGTTMQIVMQVDSNDHLPVRFGDTGCGHITQCPHHSEVVAFGWACF